MLAATVFITAEWLAAQGGSPYYLDQPDTEYVLQTDVETPGTAFAIIANGITFDLNGHTVTYDNADPVVVPGGDFEEPTPSDYWDFTNAPDAQVIEGTYVRPVQVFSGNHSLQFSVPAQDQFIRSNQTVTLQPDTTYTISMMIYNYLDVDENMKMYAGLEGTGIETGRRDSHSRGYRYVTKTFDTYNTPGEPDSIAAGTYHIVTGVRNANGGPGFVYIDDIRIQRTCRKGIVLAPQSWMSMPYIPPDISRYGYAYNSVIKNGNISQGKQGSDWADGVYMYGHRSRGSEIGNTNITVYGANAKNINAEYEGGGDFIIHDNTLYNNVTAITFRDSGDGASINLEAGASGNHIYNNTIIGGCQLGIVAGADSNVHHNHVSLKTRYSNGFAIVARTGTQIYANVIDQGSGDYSGRGIAFRGSGVKVFDNIVSVQELPRNQEYNGYCLGGAYGIQIEYAESDIEVYGNTITVYAREAPASAFRMNPTTDLPPPTNVYVHDNTFTAVSTGTYDAYAMKIEYIDKARETLRFENNTVVTNSKWLKGGRLSNLDFKSNTFLLGENPQDPLQPLVASYWPVEEQYAVRDIKFINNQYPDGTTRDLFAGSAIRYPRGGVDPYSSFHYSWTLGLNVTDETGDPISGASVLIRDKEDNEVYAGTTEAGRLETVLDEFLNEGGVKTEFNPYTVTIAAEGYETFSEEVVVDQPMELTVNLGAGTIVNQAPAAADDGPLSTEEEVPITIDVLANDSDTDGTLDPATARSGDRRDCGRARQWQCDCQW